MVPAEIKNIIFDLGGVIINLSPGTTIQRFSESTGLSAGFIQEKLENSGLFEEHESGKLSDEDFRTGIRTFFNVTCSDAEIDESWNAMLLDIPPERIALLRYLKKRYRLFLLSNTNEIHLRQFTKILLALKGSLSFDDLFEQVYYSHRLRMRKPEKEIFEYVLRENNLMAEHTLFLDDNPHNLEGAASVGIKTFLVQQPESLFSLFEFKNENNA